MFEAQSLLSLEHEAIAVSLYISKALGLFERVLQGMNYVGWALFETNSTKLS